MRVYVAGSAAIVRQLADGGAADGPLVGFAATTSVRSSLGQLADEDVEFALTMAAAESSAAAVGIGPESRGRRYVVVADVDDADVGVDDETPGAVRIGSAVALSDVDAILADPEDISLHAGVSDELAWFAPQEIGDLLA